LTRLFRQRRRLPWGGGDSGKSVPPGSNQLWFAPFARRGQPKQAESHSVKPLPQTRSFGKRGALCIAATIILLSVGIDYWMHPTTQRLHMGAEYYNIGLALADGRGFSDPFGEPTGPTAWMAPVYPAILGALISVLGTKARVATAVVVLMTASLVVQALILHAIARRTARRLRPLWAVVVYLGWVVAFYYWFFLLTSDVWLLSLLVSLITLASVKYIQEKSLKPWVWGALGGLSALTSPALGSAWGCLVVLFFVRNSRQRRKWLYALGIALCMVAPWTLRNAFVFHRFIPTKSNLMFEAYQANVVDSDGIYDLSSMLPHPYNVPNLRFEYAKLGEVAFIAKYGRVFREQLRSHPSRILRRIANRALAATVKYIPLSVSLESGPEFSVLRVVYALPFLVMALSIGMRGPHTQLLRGLGFFWFSYLFPYVIVAFYARYFLPLATVFAITAFLGIDQGVYRWSLYRLRRQRSAKRRARSLPRLGDAAA
jgi:hypothetical protein